MPSLRCALSETAAHSCLLSPSRGSRLVLCSTRVVRVAWLNLNNRTHCVNTQITGFQNFFQNRGFRPVFAVFLPDIFLRLPARRLCGRCRRPLLGHRAGRPDRGRAGTRQGAFSRRVTGGRVFFGAVLRVVESCWHYAARQYRVNRLALDCRWLNSVYTLGMDTLTTTQAAAILGLQSRTLCQYVRRRLIRPRKRPADRSGIRYEFTRSEVERFASARRRRGKPQNSRPK